MMNPLNLIQLDFIFYFLRLLWSFS